METTRRRSPNRSRTPARLTTLGGGVALAWLGLVVGACQRTVPIGDTTPSRVAGASAPTVELSSTATDMVLHADVPVVAGRNLLWCATTQLAWDAFGEVLRGLGAPSRDLRLGPPAPPTLAAAINRHDVQPGDLDTGAYVVEAGFVGEGLAARFQRRVSAMSQRFPLDLNGLDPEGIAALAFLYKDLPFEQPFLVHESPLRFDGGSTPLAAFGSQHDAKGAEHARMLRQVRLHRSERGSPAGSDDADYAVTLLPRGGADRIVLGHIARPASLASGWATVAGLLARPETRVPNATTLEVPKVDFAATHRFREVERARLLDAPPITPPTELVRLEQRLEFRLSENGARLVAAVAMASNMAASAPPAPSYLHLRFDRPFLLALVRDGAARPYFLAWFGNDRLFVRH